VPPARAAIDASVLPDVGGTSDFERYVILARERPLISAICRHPDHFKPAAWRAFAALRTSTLKVARAWALKETAANLWEYRYVGPARRFFRRWYFWATHSRLKPMIEKARMLKTHLPNVLTYLRHRITNATAEGLNSKIQWIRYTARGFRNRENFKTAIYFHCGKLDLYPH
jgi:transposase